jgi:hypothetical protein
VTRHEQLGREERSVRRAHDEYLVGLCHPSLR